MNESTNKFPEINYQQFATKSMCDIVVEAVIIYFGTDKAVLMGQQRKKKTEEVFFKYACFYLVKKNTEMSFQDIADTFGISNSNTRHGINSIENQMAIYSRIVAHIQNLQQIIDNFTTQKQRWLTHNNN
jgi:chromosomal replication initiation ATPase DnaA